MPSPDGRWLAYVSDETGGWEVYVRPFPPAWARVQRSHEAVAQSRAGIGTRGEPFYRNDESMWAATITERDGRVELTASTSLR